MDTDRRTGSDQDRPHALVWIDSHEAIVVRWAEDQARIERIVSVIPPPHPTNHHVRHDPAIRHGGGGASEAEASRRETYLARFLKVVTAGLPDDADLTVLGPGPTHQRLVTSVRSSDTTHRRGRWVESRTSSRKTDRQLVALLREIEGDEAPRRAAGRPHPSRSGPLEFRS